MDPILVTIGDSRIAAYCQPHGKSGGPANFNWDDSWVKPVIYSDQVTLTGTVRSTNETVREEIVERMHQTLTGITKAWRATIY